MEPKTYTRRENARRAAVAKGIPKERVTITVHKNGDEVRFGWKEGAVPVAKKPMTTGSKPASALKVEKEERNGVRRPKAGGVCAAVWAWLDGNPDATLRDARTEGEKRDWNLNNLSCEFYAWRRFMGKNERRGGAPACS